MAFCPATGKTYVFGGASDQHPFLDETWEWDGSSWSLVQSDVRPPSRVYGADFVLQFPNTIRTDL